MVEDWQSCIFITLFLLGFRRVEVGMPMKAVNNGVKTLWLNMYLSQSLSLLVGI